MPDMTSFMGYRVPKDALFKEDPRDARKEFERLQARFYAIISHPRLNEWVLCLMTGGAGEAFCRLFGGDWMAMAIVFFASQAAFLVRRPRCRARARHQARLSGRLAYRVISFSRDVLENPQRDA